MPVVKLTIQLRYRTQVGQNLFVCGNHPLFGGRQPEKALPLRYKNEEIWEATLDLPESSLPGAPVTYYFLLRNPDGSTLEDFGADRKLHFSGLKRGHNVIIDSWNDLGAVENVFFTEPFRKVLLPIERKEAGAKPPVNATHSFAVKAPLLPKGHTVCLLGSASAMGRWNQTAPVLLWPDEHGYFTAQMDLGQEPFPVEYKYGVFDVEKNAFLRYEDGANRRLSEGTRADGLVILRDGFFRRPWTPWRGAGVSIPVFSLRSEKSFGVGEFLDLPLLADWAGRAGLKLIQVLPVNDTSATGTWADSYPYAAISAFALHPLYLNLDRVATAEDRPLLESLKAAREKLNALPALDYEAVMKAKLAFIREIFPAQRKKTFASSEYRKFFTQNKHWLEPYAAFCFLRDKFGTADFTQWTEYRIYDAGKIEALKANEIAARDEMDFHCFIQFHLHLQLREAADYLHGRGVILKGDIAIGVSACSADVWQQPDLFHTDMQAGAPPDPFAAKGQNWGFPTYNWPRMQQDGFEWWKSRFAQMSHYFDAFRIDHILGFFRIWSIPRHAVEGILGYFVPAIPVRLDEFAARGIAFDLARFTRPFINDAVLDELFGDRAARVKRQFLDCASTGTYSLKPEFTTQRQVEEYFAKQQNENHEPTLKEGLFDLISNVLLIEPQKGGGEEFHFRLGMEQTASFRHLDQATQKALRELYLDYFFRRQDEFWKNEALQKLRALKRVTNMLICGEDLGMVPACVPDVMKDLALLTLEIQRMPKALNQVFSRPAQAPYLSVVTPSTHDMSTLRGWWRENRELTQRFFNEEVSQSGAAPSECESWVSREIIKQHLDSPAMWSIFQLQDLLGMDDALRQPDVDSERINIPAIPRHYWRYRMHVSLEDLGRAKNFSVLLENLIHQAGR
jgi:4-alpha-glucanotransferase